MSKRLKNYGLWVSIASFALLALQSAGVDINVGKYNEFVNYALGILVLLGIVSNPTTDNKGFGDDK